MSCKLNLLIFLCFLSVLGFNYYLSKDMVEKESYAEVHDSKNTQSVQRHASDGVKTKQVAKIFRAKIVNINQSNTSKGDTLTYEKLMK